MKKLKTRATVCALALTIITGILFTVAQPTYAGKDRKDCLCSDLDWNCCVGGGGGSVGPAV